MPRVTANGLDIHYERTGQGPRLLFISGTGGDLRVRPNMLDGPFARSFDLVAYDQRGLGQTEKPDRPYAMADYADDAAGLMDALGVWSRSLMVHYPCRNGRMHYGPSSSRERQHDSGNPSSNTK
jgi:3-oxoadipate enol-lactonase